MRDEVYIRVVGGKDDMKLIRHRHLESVEFTTNLKRLKARLMSRHMQFEAMWRVPVEPNGILLLQTVVTVVASEIGDLLDGLKGVTVCTESDRKLTSKLAHLRYG